MARRRSPGRRPTHAPEPLDLRIAGGPEGFDLHYSLGDTNSADSFAPMHQELKPGGSEPGSEFGPFVLAANGGCSSAGSTDGYWWSGALPFFDLEWAGAGAVLALGWTGQWEARFQQVGANVLRVQAGQQLTHFILHPGETVRTPRILVACWEGSDWIRGNNLFRQLMLAHYVPRRDGEVVLSPIAATAGWVNRAEPRVVPCPASFTVARALQRRLTQPPETPFITGARHALRCRRLNGVATGRSGGGGRCGSSDRRGALT